jgi:hypothetical protein
MKHRGGGWNPGPMRREVREESPDAWNKFTSGSAPTSSGHDVVFRFVMGILPRLLLMARRAFLRRDEDTMLGINTKPQSRNCWRSESARKSSGPSANFMGLCGAWAAAEDAGSPPGGAA